MCNGVEGMRLCSVQALFMFIGEGSCLLAHYALLWWSATPSQEKTKAKPFNPLILALPAVCDMTGTSIMYVANAHTAPHLPELPELSAFVCVQVPGSDAHLRA